jgi:hypothetical protein
MSHLPLCVRIHDDGYVPFVQFVGESRQDVIERDKSRRNYSTVQSEELSLSELVKMHPIALIERVLRPSDTLRRFPPSAISACTRTLTSTQRKTCTALQATKLTEPQVCKILRFIAEQPNSQYDTDDALTLFCDMLNNVDIQWGTLEHITAFAIVYAQRGPYGALTKLLAGPAKSKDTTTSNNYQNAQDALKLMRQLNDRIGRSFDEVFAKIPANIRVAAEARESQADASTTFNTVLHSFDADGSSTSVEYTLWQMCFAMVADVREHESRTAPMTATARVYTSVVRMR